MGDCQNEDLRVSFDSRLKLKFLGSQVTTDAGLLAYRELDEALGLTAMSAERLQDSRLGQNKQHGLLPLLRQSIYSRLAGYEDVNDAERLCIDPAMRHVVGGRASQPEKRAASTSEVGRFETETLSTKRNLKALMDLSGQWIDKVHRQQPLKQLILDLDSSVSETYGRQQGLVLTHKYVSWTRKVWRASVTRASVGRCRSELKLRREHDRSAQSARNNSVGWQ